MMLGPEGPEECWGAWLLSGLEHHEFTTSPILPSSIRLQCLPGEYLADAAAGAQSSLATAKEYATSASASLADTHAATQESAHNAQVRRCRIQQDRKGKMCQEWT